MKNNTVKKIKHLQKSINSLKKMIKTKLKKRKSKRTARGKKSFTIESDPPSASAFKIKSSIGKKTQTRKPKLQKPKLKNIIENVIQEQRRALSIINPDDQLIPTRPYRQLGER